jgi:hypothetical protein
VTTVNPRSITDAERDLVEGLSLGDQAAIINGARSLGYSDPVALGLAGWLAAKAAGLPDRTGSNTRAKYRRILAELVDATPPSRGRRSQSGHLGLTVNARRLAAAAAVTAVGVVTRNPAALALAPIMFVT